MPSRELFLRHLFSGGWATSYGPHSPVVPDAAGNVQMPYLIDAEDIIYELDGGPRCVPGATKLNSLQLESGAEVYGLFDAWFHGSAGTPDQHRIVHVGTTIKKDDANGTFADLFTGVTAGGTPNYVMFEDVLIIASDSGDVPRSWDGSTAQNLAGSPPAFAFAEVHKNKVWAAGAVANPSRLYYSVTLDGEDWSSGGSGNIDIDPSDGDRITGIASHKNELFVFKGPYKGSIHRITGSAPADFARTTMVSGVGSVNHAGIFRFGDDLGFMWSDGTVRSLSATASFGDFTNATLSLDIDTWLRDHLSLTNLRRVQAANWTQLGIVLFAIPVDGSTTNNSILMMDYRFGRPRWAIWPSYADYVMSIAPVVDTAASNRHIVMAGGPDGFVRRLGQPNRSIDGSVGLAPKITTPYLDYGSPFAVKTLTAIGVGLSPHSNTDFTIGWSADGAAQQTTMLAQSGGDVLGPADANEFTLGTSALGGSNFFTQFAELEEGGEFRAVQYQITQNVNNSDLEIHDLLARVHGGAWSTEQI